MDHRSFNPGLKDLHALLLGLKALHISIATSNEKLLDLIEALALAFDEKLPEDARRAIAEYKRGETVTLDSLL